MRGRCEREEQVTGNIDILNNFHSINFCESAQAGVILSTYQMHKTLQLFNSSTDEKLRKLDNCINKLEKGNARQGKITLWLTGLVIFLTIVNVGMAIINSIDNTSNLQLKELQNISSRINSSIVLHKNTAKLQLNELTNISNNTTKDKILQKRNTKEQLDLSPKINGNIKALKNKK